MSLSSEIRKLTVNLLATFYALWKYGINKGLRIKGLKVFNTFSNTHKLYRDAKLINHTDLQKEITVMQPPWILIYKRNRDKKGEARKYKVWDHTKLWFRWTLKHTTQPPLAEPSSFVKINPVIPTTCIKSSKSKNFQGNLKGAFFFFSALVILHNKKQSSNHYIKIFLFDWR